MVCGKQFVCALVLFNAFRKECRLEVYSGVCRDRQYTRNTANNYNANQVRLRCQPIVYWFYLGSSVARHTLYKTKMWRTSRNSAYGVRVYVPPSTFIGSLRTNGGSPQAGGGEVRARCATCARSPCAPKSSGDPRRFHVGGRALLERNGLGSGIESKNRAGKNY